MSGLFQPVVLLEAGFFLNKKNRRIFKKMGFCKNQIKFDSDDAPYPDILPELKDRHIYVKGWHFRVPELSSKYSEYFSQSYALKSCFYEGNTLPEVVQSARSDGKVIVGVHIRRGDYKTWQNGKYYFEDAVYKKYIDELEKCMDERGQQVLFIIFSNENTSYVNSEQVIVSDNEWYVDQHVMSQCDYLIGPPSTFTMWASYMVQAKLFHIVDKTGDIDLSDFSSCLL